MYHNGPEDLKTNSYNKKIQDKFDTDIMGEWKKSAIFS